MFPTTTVSPMTASDASWLRMDRPENTADIVGLLWLDGPLDFARFRTLLEERLLPIERFRRRPVWNAAGLPSWELDPDFALGRHLRHVRLPRGGLREFASDVASSGLDPAHPPWQAFVVDEEDGAHALITKIHHVIGDGFAMMAVLRALVDGPPLPAPAHPHARGPSGAIGRLGVAGARAMQLGATAARLATLRDDPEDTSSVPLSGIRRVAWTAPLPHAQLRAAARRQGATTNDLLVAAVAGGLRSVLGSRGHAVDRARRAIVPFNLRACIPDPTVEAMLGNHFGLVFLDLPVHLPTAQERLAAVRGGARSSRAVHQAVGVSDLLALCGWLPNPAHHVAAGFFSRKASVVVTNVPGPSAPVSLAGRTVTGATFWVPHPANLGLGVSILGYAGQLRVGVRADVAVLPEPADLVARVEEEVAELAGAPLPSPG